MKTAFLQCHAGISGDMFLSALLDAGLDETALREMLASVGVEKDELIIEKTVKKGISATTLRVDSMQKHHLHVSDIREKLGSSILKESVAERAIAVFNRILEAESTVHGVPMASVHLHEVSALDTIVDLLGVAWAIDHMGLERIYSTPVNVGSGTVKISHGVVPVPAPATALILKGIPIVDDGLPGERTTPTGAALAAEFIDAYGSFGSMTVDAIGYGAGSLDSGDRANVLRLLIGETADIESSAGDRERLALLETDIDDESPEIIGYLLNRLYRVRGVRDVSLVQTIRKKNRPGYLLRILTETSMTDLVRGFLFRETSTLGVRELSVDRYCRERETVSVTTQWGEISVIVSGETVSPEFEECRRIAEQHDVPLRAVYQAAKNSYFN